MAINTYKCSSCDFVEEYIESISVSKTLWHPEICPKCNAGKLEKVFDLAGHSIGIDFVGPGFFVNDYGKHAWKRDKSDSEISKYLTPDPNTGRYKDPY